MSRVQSPSSINTYKQCPRKYYYRYIEELPSKPSIYLIRGKIVHSVLEKFFDIDKTIQTEDDLRVHLFGLLDKTWAENYSEFLELDMEESKIKSYYSETKSTLQKWFGRFRKKLHQQIKSGRSFSDAFKHLTPIREKEFLSDNHQLRGFIDAIFEKNDNVVILDYKTGSKTHITPEYRLQLGMYVLMYKEATGKRPNFVGIDFLNHAEQLIMVDDKLENEALGEVKYIHSKTKTKNIDDYSKKPGPLCKWSSGQCDYYEKCFKY